MSCGHGSENVSHFRASENYAYCTNLQLTALPPYGGMRLPFAIGANVEGIPTTAQTPDSGQSSPVRTIIPNSFLAIGFSYVRNFDCLRNALRL